ncbi:hypothetical protein A374_18746 [Fictibacillus macauensis ZFHKF-1]|uniref:Uncharacterized protein n=1 Tax=Fictibacillus macauensis ZFHKF-1 TaxID=1196324 RepID=I8ADU4_9BACL|nr:hypothetical protein A374_18746 [Fictibacillus macauensis ZFHKF-1]
MQSTTIDVEKLSAARKHEDMEFRPKFVQHVMVKRNLWHVISISIQKIKQIWLIYMMCFMMEHYRFNRSAGAKLNETYLPPYK